MNGPDFSPPPQRANASLLSRIAAFLLTGVLLVLGFMFSLVALAIVAVAAIGLGGWFWWKTRALRKQMRAAAEARATSSRMETDDSVVIEGQFVREQATPGTLPHTPVQR